MTTTVKHLPYIVMRYVGYSNMQSTNGIRDNLQEL